MSDLCKFRRAWIALICALLLPCLACADQTADLLHTRGEDGHAIERLPDGIAGEDGKLTAYADYDHPLPGKQWVPPAVPLYLINRGDTPVTIAHQDMHPHLYLEVNIDGRWHRAEPFQYPSCGNSYGQITLAPETFAVFRGYQPHKPDGQAPARFRRQYIDGVELVTNVAEANYSRADLRAAELDPVAIRHEAPFGTLVGLVNGVVSPTTTGWGTQDWGLYFALGYRFPVQSMKMVNAWAPEKQAEQQSNLQTLAGAILMSPAVDADDLIRLFEGDPDNAFAEQHFTHETHVIRSLGSRFPAEAIAYVEKPGDHKKYFKTTMQGVSESPDATLDQLMWCLRQSARYEVEHPWVAGQIGVRFPDEALALRPKLRAIMGETLEDELVDEYVRQLEWSATLSGGTDRLIDVIEGRQDLTQVDLESLSDVAGMVLARRDPDKARVVAERWRQRDAATLTPAVRAIDKELERQRR